MKKYLLVWLMAVFVMNDSFATQEGILPLSQFHIESAGIGSSGKIVLDGKQDQRNKISKLTVYAFGKVYEVPQKNLDQLSKVPINGIQLSYEHGYKELGGRVIYIQFQKGFTSGVAKKVIMAIQENGEIRVF